MLLIKGLTSKAGSRHGFYISDKKYWPTPKHGRAGDWVKISEDMPIMPHFSGIHFTKQNAVMSWCWERNFIAEVRGSSAETSECVVAREGRLVRELFLSPEGWAQLAIQSLHDVINIPEEINYPWDHVKAIHDAFNIAADDFNLPTLKHAWPEKFGRDLKQSPKEYAIKHADDLLKRCVSDAKSTVEMGFNAEGVLHLAVAARRLYDLKKNITAAKNNWQIAREVSDHARKASIQFALQAEASTALGLKAKDFSPTIKNIFAEYAHKNTLVPAPIAVASQLLTRQSARLMRAWGL